MTEINRVSYFDFGTWVSRMLIVRDESGFVTLCLNARYTTEQLLERLPHELAHLALDHFDDERPIRELEAEAERIRRLAM